jgi:hypothetical protein
MMVGIRLDCINQWPRMITYFVFLTKKKKKPGMNSCFFHPDYSWFYFFFSFPCYLNFPFLFFYFDFSFLVEIRGVNKVIDFSVTYKQG